MSVFRIEKNDNYTVMSNYHLRDRKLSYKAKGLLSFMLSLPDNWDYSLNGLCSISKEGRDGIRSILKELQDNHYIEIEKVRDDKGHFEYNYLIYETPYPVKLERNNNPDMENPYMDSPHTENHTQINTNIQNTNNKDKYDKQKFPLIKELINRNFIDKDDLDILKYYDLLNELLEEYDYYDVVKVCGYIANKWQENNGLDENSVPILNKYAYFKSSLLHNLEKINTTIDLGW